MAARVTRSTPASTALTETAQAVLRKRMDERKGAIGVQGCPDFACCTASIDKVRIVFMHNNSSS
jgi:hypothetical protein